MSQRLIGVDVGGTKVSVAVLADGVLSEPHLHPTELGSTEGLLQQLTRGILDAADGDPDARVGIGVPSVIEFATGRVRSSVRIPLRDVPLREELGRRTGLAIYVDNDATVAGLAEACDAAGRPVVDSLVMFTIGTGVGGGVVVGGRIFRGSTGAAPEIGHLIIGADLAAGAPDPARVFPQPWSLETLASGQALDRLGRDRGFRDGPEVVEAARAGDPAALEALRILGERLGIGIASMINVFDPQEVVIGGGVSSAGDLLLQPAARVAWQFVLPGVGSQTTIRLARQGPEAGVLGAALLAGTEHTRVEVPA